MLWSRQALSTFDWSRKGWHSIWSHTRGSLAAANASSMSATVKLDTPIWRASPSRLTLHSAPMRVGQRDLWIRPMQQQQIDLAQPQPHQAIARRALRGRAGRNGSARFSWSGKRRCAWRRRRESLRRPRARFRRARRYRRDDSRAAAPARRRGRRCVRATPRCRAQAAESAPHWPRRSVSAAPGGHVSYPIAAPAAD